MGNQSSIGTTAHSEPLAKEKYETVDNKKPSKSQRRKEKLFQKKPWQEEWKSDVHQFQNAILDESYHHVPVRRTTIDAANLYPSSFPDRPGFIPGSHKHLGGAYDPSDGTIYGIPANSPAILVIRPDEHGEYRLQSIPLPKRVANGSMKWLRGIISDGLLWAIPAWADSVLCVDIDAYWGRRKLPDGQTDYVNLIPLPESHPKGMRWQWHGAGINKEKTGIFCVPSNAKKVLKVDTITKTTSFIDIDFDPDQYPGFTLDCTNKWYGGITGDDNAVYCIPYRASGVLRIDTETNTAKIIGPNYGVGNYFWHGGIKRNGKIYAHPSHADTVLVIDTREDVKGAISELPIHRHNEDDNNLKGTYKWLGGAVGADGNIYCPACDTSAILKINVQTDHCNTQGFAGVDRNKWQGGILGRDNCVYTIPANGVHVCRIATDPTIEGENVVQLLGDLPPHKDKWQGAAVGKDGSLYFIPENGYRVMRVTPPLHPPTIVDGKLPEDDVLMELM
ncbi:hypothetical protein IV203_033989 [Nitzschia inconspicua]|uniref:Uncharacterized protein n=1 Tax=Nitzschia inconspicua TaxID=303405 RepID=A0A9K3M3D2_9STRA|nr:hypothetical protein IV203_033989 [Nitzschia inconspicua]